MEDIDSFIFFWTIVSILGYLLPPIIFGCALYFAFRRMHRAGPFVPVFYDPAFEQMLAALAVAVQAHERQQAANLQRQLERQINQLPPQQRATQRQRLDAVVSEEMAVDPATGELVQMRH